MAESRQRQPAGYPQVLVQALVSDADDQIAAVRINGKGQVPSSEALTSLVPLQAGANELWIEAIDRAGNLSHASVQVDLDLIAPTVTLLEPKPDTITQRPSTRFHGEVVDDHGVEGLWISGSPIALKDGAFDVEVPLVEGTNTVSLLARDLAGREVEWTVDVERVTLPEVVITSPLDRQRINTATATVSGAFSGPVTGVWVNGIPATLGGGMFTAEEVPLRSGGNPIVAVAFTAAGSTISDKITLFRDLESPILGISEPLPGFETFAESTAVIGAVRELLTPDGTTITVNGLPAAVDNGTFSILDVPLAMGPNLLQVEAVDGDGNVAQRQIEVVRRQPSGDRLRWISGQGQSATVGTPVTHPLRVRLVDDTGAGLAGRPVVFEVSSGSGSLAQGKRRLAVTTDQAGDAESPWTLGSSAGLGLHRVTMTAPGARGRLLAIAGAVPGPPARLFLDSGNAQTGVAGRRLPEPLAVVVTDADFNRLPDVSVRFAVVKGAGSLAFSGDAAPRGTELQSVSDAFGRAGAELHLEQAESVVGNVVRVDLPGVPEAGFVTFSASAKFAGLPDATAVIGLVLDNSNLPVPGVTVSVADHGPHTTTDDTGYFRLDGVPAEPLHLHFDGSTTSRDGLWPHLEFELTPISGRDNDLGMPVFMVQLDGDRYLEVDETTGGVLEPAEIPGFALEVAPGSVTFPDGSREGRIAVTAVHHDKVPMVPNFGQQPRFVITIQPAGATFDPPAKMSLPNVDGLGAGEHTEMYSFDHDLGRFVSIGLGMVSEDRTRIVSVEGFGVLKAGWHCGGDPAADGTPFDCSGCSTCDGSTCVAACEVPAATTEDLLGCQCPSGPEDRCRFNYRCEEGVCKSDEVKILDIDGPCAAGVGESVSFPVMSTHPSKTRWFAPGGSPSTGTSLPIQTSWSETGEKNVTAFCTNTMTHNIEILESCNNIQTDYDVEEFNQNPTGGALGEVFRVSIRGEFGGCFSGGQWCPTLKRAIQRVGIGTDLSSVTPVTGAYDPVVTAQTCEQIIDDLTPAQWNDPYPQGALAPPSNNYDVPDLVLRHERFHISDYRERVFFKLGEEFIKYVRALGICSPCPVGWSDSDLDRMLQDVRREILEPDYFDGMHEKRAFENGNPFYRSLVHAIRARARLENSDWDACE